ncbi:hypothetical protein D9M68_637490 [compost metagenome]
MVAQAFLLLIGSVVLLVDDDQAGILQWGEQCRTGADDDVGLAVAGGQPGIQAFAVVHRRVQQGDSRVESPREALQGLRAQVDLRDQHQGLLAGFQGLADELQVDLGLATAGDSGQQQGVEAAEGGVHRIEGGALLRVERQFRLGQQRSVAFAGGVSAHLDPRQTFLQQQIEAVLVQLQLAEQLVRHAVGMLGEGGQGLALARCAGQARVVEAGAGNGMPETLLPRLRRLALAQQHRQRPAQGIAQAVLVVLRGPQAQLEQRGRQGRAAVQELQGGLELVRRHVAPFGQLHQHADDLATTEGHAQAHPRLQGGAGYPGGRPVVEQAAQGRGQGEPQDGGVRSGVGQAGGPFRRGAILARRGATAGAAGGLQRPITLVSSAACFRAVLDIGSGGGTPDLRIMQ